jgi:NADH:ubiquinone oxidoreductase subunit F (NADH-binding)
MTALASRSSAPPGAARLLAGVGREPTLASHLDLYGPLPDAAGLIDLLDDARLSGRGGGGFPTAAKLSAIAGQRGRPIVVGNGVEGEPVSKKDRALLRVAPHLVLDGATLAAEAIGAHSAIIAISAPAPALVAAIAERERRRVANVSLELRFVRPGFVAGEETAVLSALGGGAAKPWTKPPYPFERGLRGAPTLVQNVETLAHIGLLARFGPGWFGHGTALVTLAGAVARPGVHEIPFGTTLAQVMAKAGDLTEPVSAYLVGGYFGRWFPANAGDTPLGPDILGAGAIVALPASTCAAAECARVVRYLAAESAGQCGPCVHGLTAIADAIGSRPEVERLSRLVTARGACRHPDGVVKFVTSALEVFEDEFAAHARHQGCRRGLAGVLTVGGSR